MIQLSALGDVRIRTNSGRNILFEDGKQLEISKVAHQTKRDETRRDETRRDQIERRSSADPNKRIKFTWLLANWQPEMTVVGVE